MLKRVLILTMDVLLILIDFSHDPAVLGSRLVPNTLCASWGKLIPEPLSIFRPFIVDIDSIIDVYVQDVGSSVIHNVESWGCCP